MDFLLSGYSALRGGGAQQQTPGETIDRLCERVVSSSLLEDRRSAVQGLRGLVRDWRLDVGTKAMPALINVLGTDRMDAEIIKTTLETLNLLCARPPKPHLDQTSPSSAATQAAASATNASPSPPSADELASMFTEIYIKDAANVTLLLDILGEVDFYVRFNSVQFLNTLLQNAGPRLQDCVLTSPMGISRLIDLLDDRREIIRNEGLLLLIALTKTNADIQKIIAFENAFERLLAIILDEGATDGDIIVQDCLQLMQNLLRHNVSNQNLFRETNCIKQLGGLLVSKTMSREQNVPIELPLTHERIEWSEQKVANVNAVLELIQTLVGAKNPNTPVNQTALGMSGIVSMLFQLGMAIHVPTQVRSQSLLTAGDTIRGHAANQDMFARCVVAVVTRPELAGLPNQKQPPGTPRSSVLSVIQMALGRDEFTIRAAAAFVAQAYVYQNHDAQVALVSTLVPPPLDNPNSPTRDTPPVSPGSLLVSAMLELEDSRRDGYRPWFAASILLHLLRDNRVAKEMAVSVKLESGDEHISLIHKIMFTLLSAGRLGSGSGGGGGGSMSAGNGSGIGLGSSGIGAAQIRTRLSLLSLLSVWFFDCPEAVHEFLTEGSNVQFLVEQINQSSGVDPLVQGLAAFLIGICVEFNNDKEPIFTRVNLQTLVLSRIGADVFQSRLELLREAKDLNSAVYHIVKKHGDADGKTGPNVFFDYVFVEFFKRTYDGIVRSVTTVVSRDGNSGSPRRGHGVGGMAMQSGGGHGHGNSNGMSSGSASAGGNGFSGGNAGARASSSGTADHRDHAQYQATVDQYEQTISCQHQEIMALRDKVNELTEQLEQLCSQVNETTTLRSTVQALETRLEETTARHASLEREQEDLLVCLAEQDMEMSELKQRLRAHGEVFEEDDGDHEQE